MQGINRHMDKYKRGDETGSHCIIVPDTLSLCRMSRTERVHTSEDVGERMKSPLIKKGKMTQEIEKARDVQMGDGGWLIVLDVQNVIQSGNEDGTEETEE
jgi:hypothetical protein